MAPLLILTDFADSAAVRALSLRLIVRHLIAVSFCGEILRLNRAVVKTNVNSTHCVHF